MQWIWQMPSFKISCAALAAALALAAARALLVTGASRAANESEAGPARPGLTVTNAQPHSSTLALRLAAHGDVAAWQEASIGAENHGLRRTAGLVNVGARGQAGQLLAHF